MSNIHEIRTGKSTESFRNSKAGLEFSDSQCFSIIYGPNYEILDLSSNEIRTINAWTTLLQSLIGGNTVHYLYNYFTVTDVLYTDRLRQGVKPF